MTPTARSLKHLRSIGYTVCTVERWIPQTKQRLDAFGFGDLLACRWEADGRIMLVQVTTVAHQSQRLVKILETEAAKIWLRAGGLIQVHGWSKKGGRGERKTWQVSVREITLEDFPCQK